MNRTTIRDMGVLSRYIAAAWYSALRYNQSTNRHIAYLHHERNDHRYCFHAEEPQDHSSSPTCGIDHRVERR